MAFAVLCATVGTAGVWRRLSGCLADARQQLALMFECTSLWNSSSLHYHNSDYDNCVEFLMAVEKEDWAAHPRLRCMTNADWSSRVRSRPTRNLFLCFILWQRTSGRLQWSNGPMILPCDKRGTPHSKNWHFNVSQLFIFFLLSFLLSFFHYITIISLIREWLGWERFV